MSIFERNGIAAMSDLDTAEWKEVFALLEAEQQRFLSHEDAFRSPNYPWPRDPLHCWSRIWEYPYVYSFLRSHLAPSGAARSSDGPARVVDLGSGVTFFPFSVARLGSHVTCADIDPICAGDLGKAAAVVDHAPGAVDFRLIEGDALPFGDGEVDAVYCVSVLEHIPTFEVTVREVARILQPGGILLLTIDLDLTGLAEIGVENYRRLKDTLRDHFHGVFPDVTVHPADVLRSDTSQYSISGEPPPPPDGPWLAFKKRVIRPLLGETPAPIPRLAVECMVLRRS